MIARAKQTLYTDIMRSQEGSIFASKIGTDTKMVKANLQQQAMKIAQAMAGLGLGISKDGQIMTEGEYKTGEGDPVMFDVTDIARLLVEDPSLMTFWQTGVK